MLIKGVIDEDFINYKKPCMIIECPYCNFKCDKECGLQVCQNSTLANLPNINITNKSLIERYLKNDITHAICYQGLEPCDSFDELLLSIYCFRLYTDDDIVIYTGYTKEELQKTKQLEKLQLYNNIIIKFGRYIPNQQAHYDKVLGIYLASNNQYAEKIS
jgi:hypothetical protein